MLLEQTNTYDSSAAVSALRLLSKARQCAKRSDKAGMFVYTRQAYIKCAFAPPNVPERVSDVMAWNATHPVYTLYILARDGDCQEFIKYTRVLRKDVSQLVAAIRRELKHGN